MGKMGKGGMHLLKTMKIKLNKGILHMILFDHNELH